MGPEKVGKTALQVRLYENRFLENWETTTGMIRDIFTHIYKEKKIKRKVIDSALRAEYQPTLTNIYKYSDNIFVLFDPTSDKTWNVVESVSNYVIRKHSDPDVIEIVQNKDDLSNKTSEVEKIEKFAETNSLPLFQISVKTEFGIKEMIDTLVEKNLKLRE